VPKYQGDPDDNVLERLSDYLIQKFIKDHQGDVRCVLADDFNISLIMDSSRVSQIKQLMNKHENFNSYFNCEDNNREGNNSDNEQYSP